MAGRVVVLMLLILPLCVLGTLLNNNVNGVQIDVKCTQYVQSENDNQGVVDVRIFALDLKPNSTYTAKVTPDDNPQVRISSTSDYEGILWIIAKIPNGDKNTLYKVDIYEGIDEKGKLIASGDDDAPCKRIRFSDECTEGIRLPRTEELIVQKAMKTVDNLETSTSHVISALIRRFENCYRCTYFWQK